MLGVDEITDQDLEQFLDMVEKNEEIVEDLQSHNSLDTSTERATKSINDLADMIFSMQKIREELHMLV